MMRGVSISKKIRKHQYLLQEGDVNRHTYFVVKGCFRLGSGLEMRSCDVMWRG